MGIIKYCTLYVSPPISPEHTRNSTGCGVKSSPLEFMAVFSATAWNFNVKFYALVQTTYTYGTYCY